MVGDRDFQGVLGLEPFEVREPLRRVEGRGDVALMDGVADTVSWKPFRQDAGGAQTEHEVPVAVAAELSVEHPEATVQGAGIGDAAREDGVVLEKRLGGGVEIELLAGAVVEDDPAAAEEEPTGPERIPQRGEVRRILPPVVVVEPAHELAAGEDDGRVTRI